MFLLCTHSHHCIPALPGKLVLLHDSFPVAALTSLSCAEAVCQHPIKQSCPWSVLKQSWVALRACSGSLHLTLYEMLAKGNPQSLCLSFFSVLMQSYAQVFSWMKQIDCFSLYYASALNVSVSHFLIVCVELNGKKSLHAELLQHRTIGQKLQEVLRYSIISSPILCTPLKTHAVAIITTSKQRRLAKLVLIHVPHIPS